MNPSLDSAHRAGLQWWNTPWRIGRTRASWRVLAVFGALVAINVLAAVLRFTYLGAEGLWQDEIHTAITVRRPWTEILTQPLSDAQPFYFLFVHIWTDIFGWSEASLRVPGAAAGVLTVTAVYLLGRRLANAWVGLGAALLAAMAPVLVWYAQNARPYSFEGLFLAISLFSLAGYLRMGERRELVWYTFFAGLNLYTHFYSALFLAGTGLAGLLWLLSQHRGLRARNFILAHIVIAVAFLPRVPILLHDLGDIDVEGFTQPARLVLNDLWSFVGLAVPRVGGASVVGVQAAVWAAIAVSIVASFVRRRLMAIVAITALTATCLLFLAGAFFGLPLTVRYLMPVMPLYLLLAADGVGHVLSLRPLRRAVVASPVALGVALAVLAGGVFAWDNLHAAPSREDWRGLGAYINSARQRGDEVYTFPTRMTRNTDYYVSDGVARTPERSLAQACSRPRRIWLVTQLTAHPVGPMLALGKTCALVESRSFYPYLTVFLFAPPGPGQQPAESALLCNGKTPTIVGTMQDDRTVGTDGPDVIVSFDGNDVVYGQGGDDTVCGGAGDDALYGGDGNDYLDGGDGNDPLYGSNGNDQLVGGPGNDRLSGGPGDDSLDGGPGKNELNGGPGSDACRTSRADTLVACERTLPPASPFG